MMMKASFDTLNKKFTPIHQEQPSTRSLNYNLSQSTHSTSPPSTMLDAQGPAKTPTLLLLWENVSWWFLIQYLMVKLLVVIEGKFKRIMIFIIMIYQISRTLREATRYSSAQHVKYIIVHKLATTRTKYHSRRVWGIQNFIPTPRCSASQSHWNTNRKSKSKGEYRSMI